MSIAPISGVSAIQYPILINGFLVYNAIQAQTARQGIDPGPRQVQKPLNPTPAVTQAKNLSVTKRDNLNTTYYGGVLNKYSNFYSYNQRGSGFGAISEKWRGYKLDIYA